MKDTLIFLIIWVSFGLYGWGTCMADMHYKSANDWDTLHLQARDHVGISALVAVAGPIGALVSMFMSNFNQHGWEIWWHEDYDHLNE